MDETRAKEERGLIGPGARQVEKPLATETVPVTPVTIAPVGGIPKRRLLLAFAIAGVSDALSIWTEFVPPVQWLIDVSTAVLLFAVLGWRWLLLPALIAEAIPGLAFFPAWVLVVVSVAVFGNVRPPSK